MLKKMQNKNTNNIQIGDGIVTDFEKKETIKAY